MHKINATKKALLLALVLPLAACASQGSGLGAQSYNAPAETIGSGPLTPQSLLGVAPPALEGRLGTPDLRRKEPSAEVWQYRGESCSLFVYFYKSEAGSLGSSYIDARKLSGGADDEAGCLAQVIKLRDVPVS